MLSEIEKKQAVEIYNRMIDDSSLEESDAKAAYRALSDEQKEFASSALLDHHQARVNAFRQRNHLKPVDCIGSAFPHLHNYKRA